MLAAQVIRARPISYVLKNYAMLVTSANKWAVHNRELLDSNFNGENND